MLLTRRASHLSKVSTGSWKRTLFFMRGPSHLFGILADNSCQASTMIGCMVRYPHPFYSWCTSLCIALLLVCHGTSILPLCSKKSMASTSRLLCLRVPLFSLNFSSTNQVMYFRLLDSLSRIILRNWYCPFVWRSPFCRCWFLLFNGVVSTSSSTPGCLQQLSRW